MKSLEELEAVMRQAQDSCPYTHDGGPDHSKECREATIAVALKHKEVYPEIYRGSEE